MISVELDADYALISGCRRGQTCVGGEQRLFTVSIPGSMVRGVRRSRAVFSLVLALDVPVVDVKRQSAIETSTDQCAADPEFFYVTDMSD